MTLKYRYFFGGDYNPFRKERDDAYSKLTDEARLSDPDGERPVEELFPKLDSWPDYLIAESKNTFWKIERAINHGGQDASERVENLWRKAVSEGFLGDWLKSVEADEAEKAMSLYMYSLHKQFDPNDFTVDFRLYFSESHVSKSLEDTEEFNINPYE